VRRQVEERLREAIISSRFAPGEHLSDRLLCEVFGVSRGVIRSGAATARLWFRSFATPSPAAL
jgi:DNA-binding FadR family transcriptional regulator